MTQRGRIALHGRATRRRVIGAGAATAGGALLAACVPGQLGGEQPQSVGAALQPATIQFAYTWQPTTVQGQTMVELRERFQQEHPAVQVTPMDGSGPYPERLRTMFAANTPPDVLAVADADFAEFADKGAVAPIQDLFQVDRRDFFEPVLESGTYKGKLFGLSFFAPTWGPLYANITALRQAGLPGAPPNTWDELLQFAQRTTAGSGETQQWGLALPGGTGERTAVQYTLFLWQNGGELLDATHQRIRWTEPAGVEALEFMTDLVQRHQVATPTPPANGYRDGRVAMEFMPAGAVPNLLRDVQFDWTTISALRRKAQVAMLTSWQTTIAQATPHRRAAGEFSRFITGTEAVTRFNVATTGVPTRKSARQHADYEALVKSIPQLKAVVDAIAVSKTRPVTPAYPEVGRLLAVAVDSALRGQTPPRQALEEAARQAVPGLSQTGVR